MIKILNRDYGERARVVGLADGTGAIEDPTGEVQREGGGSSRDTERERLSPHKS